MKILRLLLGLSLFFALSWQTARAQASGPQYVVQPGDTLFGIALRFGTTVADLQAANPAVNPNFLSIGQVLNVPGLEGITGNLGQHTFELGESLDSLARRLGLQPETLIRLNHVVNPDLLYLDQPIVIVDRMDAGPAIPNGFTYPARAREGLLSVAAASNQNPWALAAVNRLSNPGLIAPQQNIVIPGGDSPTTALPFPLRALRLQPLPVEQGRTLSVHVEAAQSLTLTGAFGEWPLNFNSAGDSSQFALQGIYRLADPGLYPLTLLATDAEGVAWGYSLRVPVRSADYGSDPPLQVDPVTLDPTVTEPELDQIGQIVAPVTPTRYWDGLFALPSVGGVRSAFGALRAYNGGPYDSFHTGVDFSGGDDRPITAPAPGVVVFAGELYVRGNATIIDHGWGVYTGYWHQSRIEVSVGDEVETGQVIGYQGSTGRATGPHLHWEVWVGGVQVDPLQWTQESFP